MTMPRGRVVTPTVLAAIATTLAGVGPAPADLIEWTAPGDGSFHHASNWSPGMVPGSNDLAGFDQSGIASTITFNGDAQTLSLELAGGDYTFDLRGHTYAFVDIVAPINLIGTDGYALTFIDGTVTSWSAAMFGTGEWTIGAGATVDLGNDLTMAGAANDLYVDGGILTAQSARIADGASSSADVWLTGGGLLSLADTLRVGHVAGSDGDVNVGGAGSRLEAASEILAGSAGDARIGVTEFAEASFGKATFGGSGSAEVGVLDGGTMTIASEMFVDSGAVVDIADLGVVDVGGIGTRLTGGTVTVWDGGTLRTTALERTGGALWLDPGSTVEITAQDVLIGPGGPFGTSLTINEDSEVIVRQSVTVSRPDAGTNITIVGGAMSVGGDLVLGDGANEFGLVQFASVGDGSSTLDVDGGLWVGGLPNGDGGTGTVGLYGDDVLTADRIAVSVNGTYDQQSGSTYAGTLTSKGSFTQLDGLLAIGHDPPAEITSGVVVNHLGAGGGFVSFDGVTTTQGARLATGVGGRAYLTVGGGWTCNGALVIGRPDGATERAQIDVLGPMTVEGDLTLHAGAWMQLGPGGVANAHRIDNFGTISGYGKLEGDVTNAGLMDPASSIVEFAGGPGLGDIRFESSYEQTADGTLAIAIEGATQYDRLVIAGDAQLAGTLEIEPPNGYEPPIGEPYQVIIAFGVVTGTFDVEPAGYDVIYLSNGVIVQRAEPCPADLDGTGAVGFNDLALLLGNWGSCDGDCPWDLDDSNHVGFNDLALLLGSWGSCPTGGDQ